MNRSQAYLQLVSSDGRPLNTFHMLGFNQESMARMRGDVWIVQMAHDINDIYLWVLCAIGIPGNILALVTVSRMQTLCPATFFISALAAFDTISLIFKLTSHQLLTHGVHIGMFGCKMEFVILHMASMANWLLVLICAERFCTVCYKTKKPLIFSLRNCYLATGVLSATFLVVFASIFMTMRAVDSTGLVCGTYTQYTWFWVNIWYWLNASVYLFIPSVLIIPMTTFMLFKLHTSVRNSGHRRLDHHSGSETQTSVSASATLTEYELDNSEAAFSIMIFVAAVMFVVLCLPACVFYLSYSSSYDELESPQRALYKQLQHLLADSTHAINFFLYFISAQSFRTRVIEIFLCKPCRRTSYTPQHPRVEEQG